MKSILQNKKECYVCGLYAPLECHHIYFGNPNRNISEKKRIQSIFMSGTSQGNAWSTWQIRTCTRYKTKTRL